EQPMHALHPPVAARAGGEALDVERRRRNIEPRIERAAVGVFGFVDHAKKRPDACETRLAQSRSGIQPLCRGASGRGSGRPCLRHGACRSHVSDKLSLEASNRLKTAVWESI